MDIPQNIFFMTKAKEYLEKIDLKNQDTQYKMILNNIIAYLRINCQHNFIKDEVDITPDNSVSICYCTYCELER